MSTLSLCMIVKNEEKHLPGCLESVRDIVDEIVVTDTGSDDSTVEIAKSYGAAVYEVPWENDFSKARNFAMSKTTSDWILYLDADERLDAGSLESIKAVIKENKKLGVRCKIYNEDKISNKPKLQSYTRLFKKTKDVGFRGKVHEQIDDSLVELKYQIINSDILINHIGYSISKDGLKNKAERNLKLLHAEYEENPNGYTAFHLGNSYNILKDSDSAYSYYKIAADDKTLSNEYKSLSLSYCAEYHSNHEEVDKAADAIVNAVKLDPDNIITNLAASEIYFKLKRSDEAIHYCMKALDENEKRSNLKSGNRLIDVFQDNEKIIYHGLHIGFETNNKAGIEYFFDKLQKIREKNPIQWQKELSLIQGISSADELREIQINDAVEIINEQNLDFYLSFLNSSNSPQIKASLTEKLVDRFPGNVKLRNKYGLYLKDLKKTDKAIGVFKKTLDKYTKEPSPVFYLISIYLEQQNFTSLTNLIEESRIKYADNKMFINHLDNLETKINTIKQNTN